jgi:hypothetical protein
MAEREFVFNWPALGATVRAVPLSTNPDVSDWFAENLRARPMRSVQLHTLVAGSLLYWLNLPFSVGPKWDEPSSAKDLLQTEDIGRITLFMPEGRAGGMCIKYGDVTETMSYVSFGQVIEKDIPVLQDVGARVWKNLIGPKQVVITEISLEG